MPEHFLDLNWQVTDCCEVLWNLRCSPGNAWQTARPIHSNWAFLGFQIFLGDPFARTTDARIILRNPCVRHVNFYRNEKLPRFAWAMTLSSELRNADLNQQENGGTENIFCSSSDGGKTWKEVTFH
jgi:hypothetical protein